MALGFGQVPPPGVEPMPAKQEAVNGRVGFQQRVDLLRQPSDVLTILQDRKNFPVLVGGDATQPFQHLVTFERHGAMGRKRVGKQSAPQRMRMQDCAGPASAHDGKVQWRLRGRLPAPADHARRLVDFQELLRGERAFIQSRWRDRQPQGPLAHYRAEISARSEYPAALIETPSDFRQGIRGILKASARCFPAGAPRRFAGGAFHDARHGPDYRMPSLPTEFSPWGGHFPKLKDYPTALKFRRSGLQTLFDNSISDRSAAKAAMTLNTLRHG